MKNILVLVGQYLPYSSTNGNIAHNIILQLKKNGYNVIVITRKNRKELENYDEIESIPIYRINDWNLMIHHYCEKKIKSGHKIFKIILLIKKMLYYIPKLFRKGCISKYYINKIEKKIQEIDNKTKIDVIIPVSSPHEEMFAAMNYKKKNKTIKLLPYQLDRFANGNSLYPLKVAKGKKVQVNLQLEEELLKVSDKYFVLPPIYNHYRKDERFTNYLDKIMITEHPLVQNLKDNVKIDNNKINITYAGSLNLTLRNPTYLFEIMESGKMKNNNIQLDLYSFGNCQNIINKYKTKLGNTINDVGKVDHDILIEKMKKADILLTIGNNSNEEVPSKLFEYLSFCKPIIHLYYTEKDAYIKYLKDYKYSICIKMDENKLKENTKKFYDFCNKHSDVDIKFEDVYEKFKECTPEYVTNIFIKVIEEE